MIIHDIDPVLIDFGMIEIRYYGLFYIIGFAIAYFMLRYLSKEREIGLDDDDLLDLLVYAGFGMLIGARLLYFVFYNPWVFWQDPLELLMLWQGGMSFHGGIIGSAIGGYIFTRKKKIGFYKLADILVMPAALALALGRVGNFINGELYGRLWDGALCVDYSQSSHLADPPQGCRFPSQLLESLKNLLIFTVLWSVKGKKFPDGVLFWGFVGMYGLLRFLVEFVREPDPQLGLVVFGFSMGQLLSLPLLVVGMSMIIFICKKSYD